LANELPSIEALLAGPAVRKLLLMADPEVVEGLIKPHFGNALQQQAAEVLQAVPNMLEIVPQGVNKWAGLQVRRTQLYAFHPLGDIVVFVATALGMFGCSSCWPPRLT